LDPTGSRRWRRKLHNEELHSLYYSPNINRAVKSRSTRWTGHAARMGETDNTCNILVRNPEDKIPRGRSRCRWNENMKLNTKYNARAWNVLSGLG
jgi:hypothetical protein